MIIMLILIGILVGGLVGFNLFKAHMIAKYMANAPIPAATVTAMKVDYQSWQPQLSAVGTLRALRGVDVTTEVAGLVRSINFKSGDEVKQGQILAQLNADSDVALLKSLEANADLANTVYERDKAQWGFEAISKAQVDADESDLKAKRAQVAQQSALVEKKSIRAPFSGKLGISTVNPGQYLNPADKLVTLQTIDPILVDFFLPQQQVPLVSINQKITLTSDAYPGTDFTGKVTAINPKVDTSTRNVQVEASVGNAKRELLPGMFAGVRLASGAEQRYLTLPQTAITYNPYGNTVFVVKTADEVAAEKAKNGKDAKDEKAPEKKEEPKKEEPKTDAKDAKGAPAGPKLVVQQIFVQTGPTRGDQVAILSGLEQGQEVVTSGQVKLKNGTPVVIDNRVQPSFDANPKPQEK